MPVSAITNFLPTADVKNCDHFHALVIIFSHMLFAGNELDLMTTAIIVAGLRHKRYANFYVGKCKSGLRK